MAVEGQNTRRNEGLTRGGKGERRGGGSSGTNHERAVFQSNNL